MKTLQIESSELSGTICVPPSKSLLHRGLICAYLAGDFSLCKMPEPEIVSDDINATDSCLKLISEATNRKMLDTITLQCGESGTTLRLLIPIAAALGINTEFTGRGRLPFRPLSEYVKVFSGHGVCMKPASPEMPLPMYISGKLKSGTFYIPGNISSQYISGLLLALPLAEGDSEIILTSPLESKPYVDMTRDVMNFFGIETEQTGKGYRICGGQKYRSEKQYIPEPDFSQAAFWLLAKHLGHKINLAGLPEQSFQGDKVFSELLNEIIRAAGGICRIDVSQIPDLVPALAAAASFSHTETHIINAGRLRLKESDRIESTCMMLKNFGINVSSGDDYIIIHGKHIDGVHNTCKSCRIDSHNDHRIVMAATMLATRSSGSVHIDGYDAVKKSYPSFFDDFVNAGGRVII